MMKIAVFLLMLMSFNIAAQTTRTAKLKATVERLTVHSYNIAGVSDDRQDTTKIGTMRAGLTNRNAFVNLPHGARAAITAFISENLWQSPVTDSIELHILELDVREKASGLTERATLNVRYGFFKKGNKVIEYSGNSYVETGADASAYIGKLVSQSIEKVLKEFDSWWPANKDKYDDSKQNVIQINVVQKKESKDPDLIAYNNKHPLSIADFKGRPDELSSALAATYSGFALQYELKSEFTGTIVNLELTPYFDKTKSWMKPAGQNAYVLQHEQLHFDITAIKAYEFIAAAKSFHFSIAGFREEVDDLQKRYHKETEQLQEQYDQETKHGTYKDKQKLWEARIKAELGTLSAAAGY